MFGGVLKALDRSSRLTIIIPVCFVGEETEAEVKGLPAASDHQGNALQLPAECASVPVG